MPACRSWAEAEVVGVGLFAAIMKGGAIHELPGGDIGARRVVNDWRQIKLLQLAYQKELGMLPTTRKLLQEGRAGEVDLVAMMAEAGTAETVEPDSESEH
jgi:hypothetical protein